jgi:hypothetical protein
LDAQVLAEAICDRLDGRHGGNRKTDQGGNISTLNQQPEGKARDIAAAHAQGASIQAGIHGIAPLEPVTKSPVTSFGYQLWLPLKPLV